MEGCNLKVELRIEETGEKKYYIIDFIEGCKTLSFGIHEDDPPKVLKEKLESLLSVFDYSK